MFPPLESTSSGSPSALRALSARAQPLSSGPRAPSPSNGAQREGADAMQSLQLAMDSLDTSLKAALGERRARNDEIVSSLPPPSSHSLTQEKLGGAGNLEVRGGGTVEGGGGSLFHLQARSLSGNLMTSLRSPSPSPSPSPPPPPNKLAASSRPPHGWINQLVKYTEAHPVPVHLMPPPPASPSPVPSSSYELIDAMPSSAYGALAPVAAVAAGFTVAMIPDPTAGSPLHQGQGQGGQQLTPRLRPPSMLPNLNPNPNPNAQGKAPPATSSASQQEPGRLWGSRREDVMLLATWLDGMMNKVLSPQKGRPQSKNSSAIRQLHQQISMRASVPLDFEQGGLASSPIEQSEGALHIYKVAFDELRRQISIDCKERGELLSILWDRSLSLAEVRVHFEAEERLESMQSLFAEAIIEKEDLEKNMKEMEKVASITLEGHQTALGGADMTNRSLALKLAQAQTLASEMERKRRLADMTLSNEVQRRLEVDEELGTAKKLAIKTEHDMLHFRAANKRLEDEVTHLKAQLVESKREAELSREATRSAEKELSVRMHGRADDEVALARAKRDLETDEILVASYKQQVKELEAQIIQLRSLIRDQALMLSDATVRKDDVQIKLEELEKVLDEEKKGRLSSERLHTDASEKLEKTAGLLEKTRLDLANTIEKSNHDLKIERDRVADLELGEKQLENRLQDMTRRFEGKEDEWLVLKKELEAAREMVAMIAQTLRVQGLEGVPPPVDKSWEQVGPLGAMQRTLPVVQRQLEAVYEGREALRVDLGAVSERLESEIDVQKDLRQQIHESKLIEAKTMRSQEEVETKLAVSEGQTRQLSTDRDQLATHLKVEEAKVKDLRSKLSHEQSRVSHLTPFEPKYHEAEAARLDLKERLENMTDAYESASADVNRMFDGQEALKRELASLVAANHNLTEQTKKMAVLQNELEEMTMLKDTAKREMYLTGDRLERALILQATTSQQLNTAKFLLMGLSLDDEHEAYTSKMAAASSPAPPLSSEPSTKILQNPPRGTLHEDPSEPSTSAPGSPSRLPKSQGGSRWYEAKVYGVSIGAEQLAMMEERGLSSNIIKSKDNWTMLKIKMLAYFSSRLRKKLMEETMLRARLEVEMLEREAAFLEEAKLREDFILQEMVVHMKSHADRVRQEITSELWDLRGILPDVKSLLGKLTSSSALISATLTKLRARLEDVKSATTQTGAEVEPAWAAFTQDIPKDLERISPLSPTSVVEAIVRVYMRQEGTIAPDLVLHGKGTAWGVARNDTIHDALMAHYQSLSLTPGTFNAEHIAGSNGPVARLLISCLPLQEYTKVASFLFFLGLSTSHAGVKWSQESWHFFLHVLHGIRLLLAGAWRATVKEWSTLKGALIPLQAAQDLLGNLYNVNDPAELEGAVSRRLSALIVPGQAGASVDLDAFLLLLMNEFNEGNCPRQALFNPRRVTDSFLGNTANVAGSGVAHTTGVTHSLATAGSGVSVGVAANPRSQSPNPRCQSPMSSSSKY